MHHRLVADALVLRGQHRLRARLARLLWGCARDATTPVAQGAACDHTPQCGADATIPRPEKGGMVQGHAALVSTALHLKKEPNPEEDHFQRC